MSSLNINWMEACAFARRILEALHDNEIYIEHKERELKNNNGDSDIILYLSWAVWTACPDFYRESEKAIYLVITPI